MLNPQALPSVQYEMVQFAGGIDYVSPAYALSPGALRECLNWAVNAQGGYYRIPGYERFTGQESPTAAQVTLLKVEFVTGVIPNVGDLVRIGSDSGYVAAVGNPGEPYLALTDFTGTMVPDSAINIVSAGLGDSVTTEGADPVSSESGSTIVTDSDAYIGRVVDWYGEATPKQLAQFKAAAADIFRARMDPVPGEGPVRGVVLYNGKVYAFRDVVGGASCAIYKESSSGWIEVPLFKRVSFTVGGGTPKDGDVLTQGGVSATIKRVQITSGQLVGATAAGKLIITNVVGGSFAAGAATTSSGGTLTLSGAESQIEILSGGKYDFDLGNFTGSADTLRVYGCDGVNPHFEFDGEVYVPLDSLGLIPNHIRFFRNHLFVSAGASILHSGIGQPYRYNVIDGGGEIGVGDRVTAMQVQSGSQSASAMVVFGRGSTWILYGNSSADWNFVAYNSTMGALDFTTQNMEQSYSLDDRGVISMKSSLNYGNFDTTAITYNIRPFIAAKRQLACASSINRERSQYRLFFNDGYGLYCTIVNDQPVGHGIVQFPDVARCVFDGEYSTGETASFFGTDSGHVMRLDTGTSFDGAAIPSYITTNINTAKSPRIHKRFRRCALELQGYDYVEFSVGYSLDWASDLRIQHDFRDTSEVLSTTAYWDSFFWDNFYWDGRSLAPNYVELNGSGENIQIIISLDSTYISEFSINSAILHYTPRRGNR